jgi:hypothetical protein
MILRSLGFVLYVWTVQRVLATARWPAWLVALVGLVICGLAATLAAGVLLARGVA